MTRPTLYLFVGYPGAGKTTVARLIGERTDAVHLWADYERQKLFTKPTHTQAESAQLYDRLNDMTEALLSQKRSVIFDTNFNFKKDRDYLCQLAARQKATVVIIWMTTPKVIARERATHVAHSEQNGYQQAMSLTDFEQLSNHLEAPTDDEKVIKIDGTTLDIDAVAQALGL